jgi:hypothetical protein
MWYICKNKHLMKSMGSNFCPECEEPWLLEITEAVEAVIKAEREKIAEIVKILQLVEGNYPSADYKAGYVRFRVDLLNQLRK